MDLDSDPVMVPSDGAAIRERHQKYYFELVLFEVEKTLFNVPKSGFLRSNPKFFDQFGATGTSLPSDEGQSTPIELKDVTAQAFEGLLLVLYPIDGTASTYEEWLGALELATLWDFPNIRTKAIEAMSILNESNSRSTMEIVVLSKKYKIKSWLREAYIKLVQQKHVDLEELLKVLDCETVMRLFAARSYILQTYTPAKLQNLCNSCRSGRGYTHCSNGCYKAGGFCDLDCPNSGRYQECTNVCTNRPISGGLDNLPKVEAEVDKIFNAEFSRL
ncbi:hypothetical protein CPB83DRAFT_887354 [Crepidotus variabilis]|uniref:BTB domain-containing protein n=1 Tax=Crepidotus variabilis TaxID=179855 RepID=A0A9P6JJ09_9AGAR|nr:hypothetical protein CPB83DRAFT_887354 [Crepidotus variabilis]